MHMYHIRHHSVKYFAGFVEGYSGLSVNSRPYLARALDM
jgi:hypothetical protein